VHKVVKVQVIKDTIKFWIECERTGAYLEGCATPQVIRNFTLYNKEHSILEVKAETEISCPYCGRKLNVALSLSSEIEEVK
jgi:hypothetical protein